MHQNFYQNFNVGGMNIDTYRIFRMYGVTDPCLQHAIKKLLRCGRSHKSREEDIQNAIDTLKRLQVMDAEDAPMVANTCEEPPARVPHEVWTEYFPVKPTWREDLEFNGWDGPGWYVCREFDPFSYVELSGPFLSRDLASPKYMGGFALPVFVEPKVKCYYCAKEGLP